MLSNRVKALLLVVAAVALGLAACSLVDDGSSASATGELSGYSNTPLYGPDSGPITIPYCFVTDTPGPSCTWQVSPDGGAVISKQELAQYADNIEHSWAYASRVKLQYTGMCDRVGDSSKKIVVWVFGYDTSAQSNGQTGTTSGCDDSPGNTCAGTDAFVTVNTVDCPEHATIRIFSNGLLSYSRDRMNYVMIHELGHALGWQHEQDQDASLSDPAFAPGTVCTPPGTYDDAGVFHPSGSDLWNDIFYTQYDPDSIMNYCRTAYRADDGRLSDLDVLGMQAAYGSPTETLDSDGDGWLDYQDNCPYVVNAQQTDSNFESEVAVQIANGFTGDDGHRPTSSDLTADGGQSYIDRWHVAYAGDACDPVATDRGAQPITGSWIDSKVRTATQCWSKVMGGANSSSLVTPDGGTYPIRYNSNMQFNAATGGPAGWAGTQVGTTAPSFCECPYATDASATNRAKCQNSGIGNDCYYGNDGLFPAYDNSTVPGNFYAIHTEISLPAEAFYGQFDVSHVDPMPGYTPQSFNAVWAIAPDLPTFGFSAFPSGGYVTNSDHPLGVFWTQVQAFSYGLVDLHPTTPMPTTDAGARFVPNLQNAYVGTEAAWDYGICQLKFVAPFAYKWMRVPYCDPTPFPATYGYIQHMVATPDSIIATNVDGTLTEISNSFTTAALTALSNVSSGTWEELAADDRVSGQARDDTGPNAILVSTGTTRIQAAFTRSGAQIDEAQPATPVGAQSTTPLRSYAAGKNALYSLEYVSATNTWYIATRNVSDALAGTSTVSTVSLGVGVLAAPAAMAYSRTTGLVNFVDVLPSARNHYFTLNTVDPATGSLTRLWRSAAFTGTVPTATLSITTDGDVLLGFTGRGDGLYHVLQMDSTGRPWRSTSGSGDLYGAVVGHSGSITIPLTQTVTTTTPNAQFINVAWSGMTTGSCGSSWLQTNFGRAAVAITGALHNGLVCP